MTRVGVILSGDRGSQASTWWPLWAGTEPSATLYFNCANQRLTSRPSFKDATFFSHTHVPHQALIARTTPLPSRDSNLEPYSRCCYFKSRAFTYERPPLSAAQTLLPSFAHSPTTFGCLPGQWPFGFLGHSLGTYCYLG